MNYVRWYLLVGFAFATTIVLFATFELGRSLSWKLAIFAFLVLLWPVYLLFILVAIERDGRW